MDNYTVTLIMIMAMIFPSLQATCNTSRSSVFTGQIVSFRRLMSNQSSAYLKYHLDSNGKPANLSFTGTKDDPNTRFQVEKQLDQGCRPFFNSIRPIKNTSFAIAAGDKTITVQYTGNAVTHNNRFRLSFVLQKHLPCPLVRIRVRQSKNSDGQRKFIKSNKQGVASVTSSLNSKGSWLIVLVLR